MNQHSGGGSGGGGGSSGSGGSGISLHNKYNEMLLKFPPPIFSPFLQQGHQNKKIDSVLNFENRCTMKGSHTKALSTAKFSPIIGKLIASASGDCTVNIWDYEKLKEGKDKPICTLTGHSEGINDLSWSTDGRYLCTASDDMTIKIWDIEKSECVKTLNGHTNYVFCVNYSPQSNQIVSGSFDEAVRLWDVRTGSSLRVLPAHSDPVTCVHFNRDSTLIASSSYDGLIRVWNSSTGQCVKTIMDEDKSPIVFAKFSPNGKYILAANHKSKIKLWDYYQAGSAKVMKTYEGHHCDRYCVQGTFSLTSGLHVVCGSEDGSILLWDLQSKKVAQHLANAHSGAVLSVDAHPCEASLISTSVDTTLKLWLLKDRKKKTKGNDE